MAYLVRKITRSKWPKDNFVEAGVDELSADAISSCLRTSSNTLSTWEVADKDRIEDAVLALVTAGDHIDTFSFVYINKEELLRSGFNIMNTPGETRIKELVHTHKDIAQLTYKSVGEFASFVLEALEEKQVVRYTVAQLKTLLLKAISEKRLDIETLSDKMRSKLGA